jgi:catechol 2,3-dioxygenase-like lactoylglutathione lyase family enzyme
LSSTAELDHAGVHVTDLERSVAFYRDVLGLREQNRFTLGRERLVFMSAGDGWVELVADGRPARGAGAVDHLALRVDDVAALAARLRDLDVELLDEAPIDVPELGARILFCLGPDGERIELIER